MKKVKKDVRSFVGAGVGIGLGSAIVGGAGGSTAGLGTMGSMMRPVAMASMGGHTLRMLRKYSKKRRR